MRRGCGAHQTVHIPGVGTRSLAITVAGAPRAPTRAADRALGAVRSRLPDPRLHSGRGRRRGAPRSRNHLEVALGAGEPADPEYRFYLPRWGSAGLVGPKWPDHISTLDAEYPAGDDLPALHESRLRWPERDTPPGHVEPLSPDEVVARAGITISCSEKDPDDPDLGRSRNVTLSVGDRQIEHRWDMELGERKFAKPWPPPAAAVLARLAESAAEVDDGRGVDDWLLAQPDGHGEELVKELDREMLEQMLGARRSHAWRLYRLLGGELYEALVASHRRPVPVVRFEQRSPEERRDTYEQRLRRAGGRMRKKREAMGLTLAQAAGLLGLSPARVAEVEQGADLSVVELTSVCELYETSPGRLPC